MIKSLKTRLLALQALGAIMANLTDTSPEAQSKCTKVSTIISAHGYLCTILACYSNAAPYMHVDACYDVV